MCNFSRATAGAGGTVRLQYISANGYKCEAHAGREISVCITLYRAEVLIITEVLISCHQYVCTRAQFTHLRLVSRCAHTDLTVTFLHAERKVSISEMLNLFSERIEGDRGFRESRFRQRETARQVVHTNINLPHIMEIKSQVIKPLLKITSI